jgi:protein TonB
MKYRPPLRSLTPALLGAAALLASCSTSSPPDKSAAGVAAPAGAESAPQVGAAPAMVIKTSHATNPRAYRADAAQHIYAQNQDRIWKGRMPPMLYAIGVLQVEVDGRGNVRNLSWMRAPKHAPEVIAEIEKTVRASAPFPVPARMGKVVYTDTWLWHKSGRFQLDTLTEGQAEGNALPSSPRTLPSSPRRRGPRALRSRTSAVSRRAALLECPGFPPARE